MNKSKNKNTKSNDTLNTKLEKGDCDMAVLAKPSNIITMLDKRKINQFLEESEKNMVDSDFLKKCKESEDLLRGKRNNTKK